MPCPLCEVQDARMTSLEAFVLGVALALDGRTVQGMCCTVHGRVFAETLIRMLAKLQRLRRAREGD